MSISWKNQYILSMIVMHICDTCNCDYRQPRIFCKILESANYISFLLNFLLNTDFPSHFCFFLYLLFHFIYLNKNKFWMHPCWGRAFLGGTPNQNLAHFAMYQHFKKHFEANVSGKTHAWKHSNTNWDIDQNTQINVSNYHSKMLWLTKILM